MVFLPKYTLSLQNSHNTPLSKKISNIHYYLLQEISSKNMKEIREILIQGERIAKHRPFLTRIPIKMDTT